MQTTLFLVADQENDTLPADLLSDTVWVIELDLSFFQSDSMYIANQGSLVAFCYITGCSSNE